MKSFLQYISEIFNPSQTQDPPKAHPDYQGLNDQGQHTYWTTVGPYDHAVESVFSIAKIGDYPRAAEVEFSVNGSHKPPPHMNRRTAKLIMDRVFSHMEHYIRTQRPDAFFYDTQDPTRHWIYQMAARRFGIPAFNYTNLDKKKQ